MIKQKNPELEVQKVDERKRKLSPKPKPTVKQLLDKYTSHKSNNVLVGLEVLSVLDPLLDLGGMSIGEETHMIDMAVFQ
jgi:hypothetical protein